MSAISDRITAVIAHVREQSEMRQLPPRYMANDALKGLDPAVVRKMAEYYLVDQVSRIARDRALVVEQQAEVSREELWEQPRSGRARRRNRVPDTRRWDGLARILVDYAAELKMIWTEELLDTAFALPDGSLVLWGDATIEQHTARRGMFLAYAHANMEGAARHEQAIHDLSTTGAPCLREMTRTAA